MSSLRHFGDSPCCGHILCIITVVAISLSSRLCCYGVYIQLIFLNLYIEVCICKCIC
jgi:hypothetical protein